MNEEEAIERIHDLMHTCDVGIAEHGEYDDLFLLDKRALETVLNLIETQKHTIEGKEALIDTMTHNEEVFNEIIENKNKIINLMAEQLTTPINGKEWVIEYYTKLAEEEK